MDDSIRVHYKTYGKSDTALVFVHGFGCDVNAWQEQFAFFATRAQSVYVELPGFGQSDKPHVAYSLDFFARSVKAVLDTLQIQHAVLIGHSLGTPICMDVAKRYPGVGTALCDVDGVYCLFPTDSTGRADSTERADSLERADAMGRADSTERADYTDAVESFAHSFDDPATYAAHMQQFIEPLFIDTTPAFVRTYATQTMMQTPQFVTASVMTRLIERPFWDTTRLNLPTLIFCSIHSGIPEQYEDQLARFFPNREYHQQSNTGHFMMMEDALAFNQTLWQFIRSEK